MPARVASIEDIGKAMGLWVEMLEEMDLRYGDVMDRPVSRQAIADYRRIMNKIIKGYQGGTVVVWERKGELEGVVMVVERPRTEIPERWKKSAWVHGVYVRERYRKRSRAVKQLYDLAFDELRKQDFTDVIGFVPVGNEESFRLQVSYSGTPYAILMEMSLL